MSITSPTLRSFQPLAESTSRVGSYSFVHSVTRCVSNWPQPSLNTTHAMMHGWLNRPSIMRFNSRSYCLADSGVRLMSGWPPPMARSPLGMSWKTSRPSRSHQ